MTFDELELIVRSIAISQQETAAFQRETAAFQREIAASQRETQQIVQSIAGGVQAMHEHALTDELKREEEKAAAAQRTLEHERRMQRLEDISSGLIRLYGSLDEDRPTVFRALNTIDRKVDDMLGSTKFRAKDL